VEVNGDLDQKIMKMITKILKIFRLKIL